MDAAGSSRAYLARCRRSPPVRMQAPAQPLPSHPLALRVHRALGSPAANAATRPLPVRTMLGTTAASFDPTRVLRAIERNDRVTFELYWCPNPRLAYSDEDIYLLTRALRNNTVLRSISIIRSKLSPDACMALVSGLRNNQTLTELDLSSNPDLGSNGVAIVSELLLNPKSNLLILNLAGSNAGDHGAKALGNALLTNSTLQRLNLSDASVGNDGALSLVTAVANNCHLRVLQLSQNPLQEQVLLAFANALRGNTYLWTLYLPRGAITPFAAAAFASTLKYNATFIMVFNLDEVGWEKVRPKIQKYLDRNVHIRAIREGGGWRPLLSNRAFMPAPFNRAVMTLMMIHRLRHDSILQLLPIELIFEIITYTSMQVEWWL